VTTADELERTRVEKLDNCKRLAERDGNLAYGGPELMIYSALMEIAKQLAELNEHLAMVDSAVFGK
jgi:hypothetical protein